MYARYYNEARTHFSLAKDEPITRPMVEFGGYNTVTPESSFR